MSILPTTRQLGKWLAACGDEKLDTIEKVQAMLEHIAYQVAINAAEVCKAEVQAEYETEGFFVADAASRIQKLISEAQHEAH